MRRREFISALGGAAVTRPSVASPKVAAILSDGKRGRAGGGIGREALQRCNTLAKSALLRTDSQMSCDEAASFHLEPENQPQASGYWGRAENICSF
jgi:hypothetical protein